MYRIAGLIETNETFLSAYNGIKINLQQSNTLPLVRATFAVYEGTMYYIFNILQYIYFLCFFVKYILLTVK